MANLLDSIFASSPDDPRYAANMSLFANMINGNLPQGLLSHAQILGEGQDRKLKRSLLEAQIAETAAQADERKTIAAQRQAEAARQAGIHAGLPGLFQRPGLAGGEARPQAFAGTDVPMFSAPMGVAPMRATPGGFDMQRALTELRMKPEEAKAYAEAAQFGRPKVARTVEVMRDGKPVLIQLDESGQEIGAGYDQWKAPVMQGLGDRVAAIDPVSLQPRGSFPMGQSPDSKASTAVSWANYGLNKDRLDMERGNMVAESGGPSQVGLTKQFGKAAPGYRWKADGTQEAIPGGPADVKAGVEGAKATQRRENAINQADVVIGTIDDAMKKAGWWETGLTGAVAGMVPGTNSYDLRRMVDTVKANIGFDALQKMRESSPTGGALGQVAVQELNFLQSTIGNLDPNQSPKEVRARLEQVKKHYENWKNAVTQANAKPTQPPQNGAPDFTMTPTQSTPAANWGIQRVK